MCVAKLWISFKFQNGGNVVGSNLTFLSFPVLKIARFFRKETKEEFGTVSQLLILRWGGASGFLGAKFIS